MNETSLSVHSGRGRIIGVVLMVLGILCLIFAIVRYNSPMSQFAAATGQTDLLPIVLAVLGLPMTLVATLATFGTFDPTRIFLPGSTDLNRFEDSFYCIMRLIVGLMFACHGLDKIFGAFKPKGEALPTEMLLGGWVEIVCGFLVAFGLLTRLAAFIASGEMAVAFFAWHAPKSLIPLVNKGELAVVYCFLFFYIFLRDSGSWSIDAMIGKGKASAATTA